MSLSHGRRSTLSTEEEPLDTLIRIIDEKLQGSPQRKASVFGSMSSTFSKPKTLNEERTNALSNLSESLKQLKETKEISPRIKTQLSMMIDAHHYVMHQFYEAYLTERTRKFGDSKKGDLMNALIDILKKFSDEVKLPRYKEFFIAKPEAALKNTDEARILATTTKEEAEVLVKIYFKQSMIALLHDKDTRENDKTITSKEKDDIHKEEKHYVVNCAKMVKRMGDNAVTVWNNQVKETFGDGEGAVLAIKTDSKHTEAEMGVAYNKLLESKDENVIKTLDDATSSEEKRFTR